MMKLPPPKGKDRCVSVAANFQGNRRAVSFREGNQLEDFWYHINCPPCQSAEVSTVAVAYSRIGKPPLTNPQTKIHELIPSMMGAFGTFSVSSASNMASFWVSGPNKA